ncbi:hypothetical protein FRB90_010977 [Tulasnella sp. 427]|nr:hypothetical protein FRB90_010977 [Tulasnella sp. 427]
MSSASKVPSNLTPQQLNALSNIILIEKTGGSAAYLKSLPSAGPDARPKLEPFNPKDPIESEVYITVETEQFCPGHFKLRFVTPTVFDVIDYFEGVGYGSASGPIAKFASVKGSLTLDGSVGWDGLVKASDVTFRWVPSVRLVNLIAWHVYIAGKPVMAISAFWQADVAGLVDAGGPMTWTEREFFGPGPVKPPPNHAE